MGKRCTAMGYDSIEKGLDHRASHRWPLRMSTESSKSFSLGARVLLPRTVTSGEADPMLKGSGSVQIFLELVHLWSYASPQ